MTTPARSTLDTALRALADGNRRAILSLVRDRPLAVGEIADRTALSQQTVSHHLQVLRGAGLVSERRDGTRHLFAVHTDGLTVVREFLDGFWPTRLAALKRAAEAAAEDHAGDGADHA
jgi:DNA-binding transcriptional ArsR family regulator